MTGRPKFNPDMIPEALKALPNWVGWAYGELRPNGKRAKPPIDIQGRKIDPTNPANWLEFNEAVAALQEEGGSFDGIGFALAADDQLVCIDLDDCVDDAGRPNAEAQAILDQFASYTERSPSGKGFHIWVRGELPKVIKKGNVELYDRARYITVTGLRLDGVAVIAECQRELDGFIADLERGSKPPNTQPGDYTGIVLDNGPLTAADEALIERIRASDNGPKFDALMKGDLSSHNGDQSAVDQSLCSTLARPCKGDTAQMCRIFGVSQLAARSKWQDRPDYQQRTIYKALHDKDGKPIFTTGVNPPPGSPPVVTKEWQEPLPLDGVAAMRPYPKQALPPLLEDAVDEVAGYVQAPLAMVASSALAAVSLAVQGHCDVARDGRLISPTSLFIMVLGDSGERKSTCDGFFLQPIRAYERETREALQPGLRQYRADKGAWEAKQQGVLAELRAKAKGNTDTAGEEARLLDLAANEPRAPKTPVMLLADETPENLAWTLVHDWPSSGIISSEAGLVLGSHAMGSESIARNLGLLNVLWDGGSHRIGRRTRESFTVHSVRLTVFIMSQVATLLDFVGKTGNLARGTGFFARFLLAWPDSTQGTRFYKKEPKAWPCLSRFHARLSAILNADMEMAPEGLLSPKVMRLSTGGHPLWREFHDEIEGQLGKNGIFDDVRDVASKIADNATRLAALFQVLENSPFDEVSAQNMRRGISIAAWHLGEAQRIFRAFLQPQELQDAARLETWLLGECAAGAVTAVSRRRAQQFGPIRNKAQLDAAIQTLADHDRAREIKDGPKKLFELNPELLKENQRRGQARDVQPTAFTTNGEYMEAAGENPAVLINA